VNTDVLALLEKVQSTADVGYVTFDSINATNAFGDNALHCVCVWGDLEAAKLLVENGINLNQQGEHGFTPLRVAADFGHNELTAYLISKGADPAALEAEETFDRAASARHMAGLDQQIEALEKQLSACGHDAEGDGGKEFQAADSVTPNTSLERTRDR
jgi:ankyrin repeat protein